MVGSFELVCEVGIEVLRSEVGQAEISRVTDVAGVDYRRCDWLGAWDYISFRDQPGPRSPGAVERRHLVLLFIHRKFKGIFIGYRSESALIDYIFASLLQILFPL